MRFFEPDEELLKSLVEYANGRIILDIGCGTGKLAVELKELGAKVMCFEPFLSDEARELLTNHNIMAIEDYAQRWPKLLNDIGNKGLLLFARPCHYNFVVECLDLKSKDTEALYITVPENLELYNDLGNYEQTAKRVTLEGSSNDKEVILSIC